MNRQKIRMSADYTVLSTIVSNSIVKGRDLKGTNIDDFNLIDLIYLFLKGKYIVDEDGVDNYEEEFIKQIKVWVSDEVIIQILLNTLRYCAETIIMLPVDSSNVKEVGYDSSQKELYVNFINGGQYKYFDVNNKEFAELLASDSKGKFLNEVIKPSKDYDRI